MSKHGRSLSDSVDEFIRGIGRDVERAFEEARKSDFGSTIRKASSGKGKAIYVPVKPGETIYIVRAGKMEEKTVREVHATLKGNYVTFEYSYEVDADMPKGGHSLNPKTETVSDEHVFVTLEEAFEEYRRQQSGRATEPDQQNTSDSSDKSIGRDPLN